MCIRDRSCASRRRWPRATRGRCPRAWSPASDRRRGPRARALSGLVVGQTLATQPEDTYRALLEATAFGTRTIVEAFNTANVPVTELVVAGGLLKNALLMQIYADVTRLPLSTMTSEQGPALGSAIHAAVAAGAYPDIRAAAQVMGSREVAAYTPIEENAARYDALFAEYTVLHDYFGRGGNDVMHRLKAIRRAAIGGRR